jgi:hypothetical protein
MTPEEINQTMEFILRQQANFWAGMEEMKARNKELQLGLQDFRERTDRFVVWATEVVAIQSRRLDEHDRQFERRDREFKEQLAQRDREFKQQLQERRQAAERHRQEDEQFRRDVMRALNLILSRLFPSNN